MSSSAGYDRESTGNDRSLGELFSDMTSQLSTLFRKEVELARAEVRQELSRAGQAAGMLAAAAVFGLGALALLGFSLAFLLSQAFDSESLGFFVTGLLLAIIGAVLFQVGRGRLKEIDPKPNQTIETLKEDAQTIRERRP